MGMIEREDTRTTAPVPPARARLLAPALAAVLAIALAIWLAALIGAVRGHLGVFDFSEYYAVARAVIHDPHADIYSQAAQMQAVAGMQLPNPPPPYLYPPFADLLFIPLALLPFGTAAAIWLGINTMLWAGCTLLLAHEAHKIMAPALPAWMSPSARCLLPLALAAILCLASRPVEQTLALGQINLLVLAPLALVPMLTRRGHERGIGVAIAVAAMLKLTPVVLLAYLVLRRRWQALGAALATLAALMAVGVAVHGVAVVPRMIAAQATLSGSTASFANNESLVGPVVSALLLAHPGAGSPVLLARYGVLALVAVVAGFALAVRRTSQAQVSAQRDDQWLGEDAAYGAALCTVILLSPAAWAHHYTWLLAASVPVAALALRAYLEGRVRRVVPALALLAGLVMNLPFPFGWDTTNNAGSPLLLGVPVRPFVQELRPLAALLIFALGVYLLRCFDRVHGGVPAAPGEVAASVAG
ncbi:MAG TPA: glycosyltransferase family 87 protein [Ktedonobacterales bacterium]